MDWRLFTNQASRVRTQIQRRPTEACLWLWWVRLRREPSEAKTRCPGRYRSPGPGATPSSVHSPPATKGAALLPGSHPLTSVLPVESALPPRWSLSPIKTSAPLEGRGAVASGGLNPVTKPPHQTDCRNLSRPASCPCPLPSLPPPGLIALFRCQVATRLSHCKNSEKECDGL